MRTLRLQCALLLLVPLLAAGCASGGGVPAETGAGQGVGGPLSADLVRRDARSIPFVLATGASRTIRIEPSGDGAVLWFEGEGPARRMDIRSTASGYVFSGGPGTETELLRFGAAPGTEWTSGAARVRFDGWERLILPGGTFDVARVRSISGPPSLEVVETWWFAPGEGLVRLRSDKGGVFAEEMSIAK